jgi:autotransporter-associated beta strand protein
MQPAIGGEAMDPVIAVNRGASAAQFFLSQRRWRWAAAIGLLGLAWPRLAEAETIRGDVSNSQYTALSAQSQYAASGFVSVIYKNSAVFGSGTLIAPDWILTAAHVVTVNETGPAYPASDVTFGQGASATPFTPAPDAIAQVVIEPGYSGNGPTDGNDLALIQLRTPITNVTPATLYNRSLGSLIAQTATVIGYGESGTGAISNDNQLTSAGTRRGMQNVIDAYGDTTTTGGTPSNPLTYYFTPPSQSNNYLGANISSNILLTDFDSPTNPSLNLMGSDAPLPLEGSIAPGDSGGGLFVTVTGQTYLAGVSDFDGTFNSRTAPLAAYGSYAGYTDVTASMSTSFIDSTLVTTSAWNLAGGGTWASIGNWTNGDIPEFAGATANFTSAIQSPSTITLNGNWTAGAVNFNNVNSYTLAPGSNGALILDNGGSAATAAVTDNGGSHAISAPVVLNSNLLATVVNSADHLTISGNISGVGSLTAAGSGTITLSGVNTYAGSTKITGGTLVLDAAAALPSASSLTIKSGATVQLASGIGTVTQTAVNLNSGSTLDLANNGLLIDYGTAANDPITTIVADLTAAYGNNWAGTGLTSSTAAANPGDGAIGYIDGGTDTASSIGASNELLVKYTIPGDTNLDGTVNFADLLSIAQHFDTTGNDWFEGNLNYDSTGLVNFSDLLLVAQNFGQSLTSNQAALVGASFTQQWNLALAEVQNTAISVPLPEPGSAGLLMLGAIIGLLPRRRRAARS